MPRKISTEKGKSLWVYTLDEIDNIDTAAYVRGQMQTEKEIFLKMIFYGFSNEEIHLLTGHRLDYIALVKQKFDRNSYREEKMLEEKKMEERRKIPAEDHKRQFDFLEKAVKEGFTGLV
jgi:hypothetical protein